MSGLRLTFLPFPQKSKKDLILFACFTFSVGEPKDGGLLPRSLDVVFNSVHNRLYSRMDLKPNMHSDVQRLTLEQEQAEVALKESILKMTFIDVSVCSVCLVLTVSRKL